MSERALKLAAYAAVYLVWGSTYLAMHIALETLPAFELAGMRFLAAGAVLFVAARAVGEPWPTRGEWLRSGAAGIFLCCLGNGTVLWSLQRVPSGVAALLVATMPFFLALLSRTITRRGALGIALGLVGIAILVGPGALAGAGRTDPVGAVALVLSSLAWSIGTLVQRKSTATPLMGSSLQMLVGGAVLLVAALTTGTVVDPLTASARSWTALVYLTLLGSVVTFTAYTWLMARDPPARVATYAYVNPVVAVALGALLDGEPLSARVLVAGAVIVAGVVVIVRGKS